MVRLHFMVSLSNHEARGADDRVKAFMVRQAHHESLLNRSG